MKKVFRTTCIGITSHILDLSEKGTLSKEEKEILTKAVTDYHEEHGVQGENLLDENC